MTFRTDLLKIGISLTICYFLLTSFISDPSPKSVLNQNQTLNQYRTHYNPIPEQFEWDGSLQACQAGTIPNHIYKTALKRINFFRNVNGLPSVKMDPTMHPYAQEAALMMAANNQLSHSPSREWSCYSGLGRKGARISNLTLGEFDKLEAHSLVTGFIWDYGAPNYHVAHRRWLLYSRLESVGYGLNYKAEAINVAGGIVTEKPNNLPEFIAYPWNGYVPVDLIFPKWSFSIPEGKKIDFSRTKISMKDWKGHRIKVLKFAEKKMLDPTIVWEASGLFTPHEIKYGLNSLKEKGFIGKFIQVYVENVIVDGQRRDYSYEIRVIDPE